MTKSSDVRKLRKLVEKNPPPANGILKLKVPEDLTYKLMAMSERIKTHQAEKLVIETKIAHAIIDRNRVIAEIAKQHEKRLDDDHQMTHMDFATRLATFEHEAKTD